MLFVCWRGGGWGVLKDGYRQRQCIYSSWSSLSPFQWMAATTDPGPHCFRSRKWFWIPLCLMGWRDMRSTPLEPQICVFFCLSQSGRCNWIPNSILGGNTYRSQVRLLHDGRCKPPVGDSSTRRYVFKHMREGLHTQKAVMATSYASWGNRPLYQVDHGHPSKTHAST